MKIKQLLQVLLDFVPQEVPGSDLGIERLIERVLAKVGVPSNPSTQQAVAVMIQGLLRDRSAIWGYRISVNRLAEELKRGMANQAAFNIIQAARGSKKNVSEPQGV